jgi:fructose PTS system EIIBC or EIIC component
MPDSSIISPDVVLLDVDAGADKESVIGRLATLLAECGRAIDRDGLITSIMEREAQSATGLPGGIAIPHARLPMSTPHRSHLPA